MYTQKCEGTSQRQLLHRAFITIWWADKIVELWYLTKIAHFLSLIVTKSRYHWDLGLLWEALKESFEFTNCSTHVFAKNYSKLLEMILSFLKALNSLTSLNRKSQDFKAKLNSAEARRRAERSQKVPLGPFSPLGQLALWWNGRLWQIGWNESGHTWWSDMLKWIHFQQFAFLMNISLFDQKLCAM